MKLDINGLDLSEVKFLLKDALGDFIRARRADVFNDTNEGIRGYINNRYPARQFSEEFRTFKYEEVQKRVRLARLLRHIIDNAE